MKLQDLETPCLILDQDKLSNNIHKMNVHLKSLGAKIRPHVKTVKSIDIINMVMNDQCIGIAVSTLKEAEYFLDKGIKDIVYAVGIAPVKLDHVAELMKNGADIKIILDNIEQSKAVVQKGKELNITYQVLLEIDCDGHRSGIKPNDPALLKIGKYLNDQEGAELKGVLTHAGESYNCKSVEAIKQLAAKERILSISCAETLRENNLPCPIVSTGSTPTATFTDDLSGITEIRAGVYMFKDLVMAGLGVCDANDIALSVLASVIGYQKEKGWIIIDAGWLTLSRDRGTASQKVDQGYGLVCNEYGKPLPDLIVSGTNQEHGIISDRNGKQINYRNFPVGSILRILPNHACATAASHNHYNLVNTNSTEIIDVWHRINGW